MPCPIRSPQGVKPAPPRSICHFACAYPSHPAPFACPPFSALRPPPPPCRPLPPRLWEKNIEKQSSASGAPHANLAFRQPFRAPSAPPCSRSNVAPPRKNPGSRPTGLPTRSPRRRGEGAGRPKRIANREHAQITRCKWEFVKFVLVVFVKQEGDPPLPNTNKPVIVNPTGATGHPAAIARGAPSLPTKYHALIRSSRPSPQRGGTTRCKPTTSAPGEHPPFRPDRTRL